MMPSDSVQESGSQAAYYRLIWRRLTPPVLAGLAGFGCAVYLGLQSSPLGAFDDAFITFRYADNLRRGMGFVYNPGEWVLGTTAPLYGLILGLAGALNSDLSIAQVGHWVGVMGWGLACWFAAALFWQMERLAGALAAAVLVALQPAMLASLGMETPLVVALMLFSAWAWMGSHRTWPVLSAALLILTRPDGALWVGFLGLERWRRQGRLPWREAAGALLLIAPWLVFAQWRYGSFLPNSVSAKIGQTAQMAVGGQGQFLANVWHSLQANHPPIFLVVFLFGLLLGLTVIALWERRLWWIPGWLVAYLLCYQWLGVATFPWYLAPPMAVAGLLQAIGIGVLIEEAGPKTAGSFVLRSVTGRLRPSVTGRLRPSVTGRLRPSVSIAVGLVLWAVLIAGGIRGMDVVGEQRADAVGSSRLADYRAAGLWFADQTDEGARIAAIEIGILGFYARRPILDTMGLVSPDVTRHLTGWSDTLIYAITAHWPEYAVVLPNTAWDGILPQWWFAEHYRHVNQFGEVSIYQRSHRPVPGYQVESEKVEDGPLPVEFAGGLRLTGADFDQQRLEGGPLDAWLHFRVGSQQPSNYQLTAALVDLETGERTAVTTTWPYFFPDAYPAQRWRVGEEVPVPLRLVLPADLRPGTYRLGVLLYDPVRGKGLPLSDASDLAYPEVQLGYLRSGDPAPSIGVKGMKEFPVEVGWQDGIALRAISTPDRVLSPGDQVPVALDWQAVEVPRRDWLVFVHLVDRQGAIIVQKDRRPFHGRFATPVWQPGETLRDVYALALPPDLQPGSIGLRIGLYDGGGRLALADFRQDDSLFLEEFLKIQPRQD